MSKRGPKPVLSASLTSKLVRDFPIETKGPKGIACSFYEQGLRVEVTYPVHALQPVVSTTPPFVLRVLHFSKINGFYPCI